ncbi:hypothetical protein Celaphus_00001844, partial [Cervus elaphus hippelaphus]
VTKEISKKDQYSIAWGPDSTQIYAAGFDSSKNSFLGKKSGILKVSDGQRNGLNTNGRFYNVVVAYSRRPFLPPVVKNSVLRQKINAVLPQNPIEFKALAFPSINRKDGDENSHGYS